MAPLHLILVVAALLCELLAAFNTAARVNLVALGLACFFGSLLL